MNYSEVCQTKPSRQTDMRGPLLVAIDHYNQELADRHEAFTQGTTELPLDIRELIWSLVPLPEPPLIIRASLPP